MSNVRPNTNDEAALSSFVQSSTTVSAEQAASIIQRIVCNAVSKSTTIPTHVTKLGKGALQKMFQAPNPSVLPHLLPLCERDTPLQVIDVFVLCTAAWKAVSAAAVLTARNRQLHAPTALRIVLCACRAALAMLIRTVTLSKHLLQVPSDKEAQTHLTRAAKVAQFYCLNASRCSNAFVPAMSLVRGKDEVSKQQNMYHDTLSSILRLSSFMTYILSTHEKCMSSSVFNDLLNNVAPLVSSTLQATLVMSKTLFATDLLPSIITETLQACANPSALQAKDINNQSSSSLSSKNRIVDPAMIRIYAIIHLMRFATTNPPDNLPKEQDVEDKPKIEDHNSPNLTTIFQSTLCRCLFACIDDAYDSLLTVRESRCNLPVFRTASKTAAECMAAFTMRSSDSLPQPPCHLCDALLVEMSSRNPLRATFAADGITSMYTTWTGMKQNHPESSRLLLNVLRCARRAYALRSAHSESRWIALSARLVELDVHNENLVFHSLLISQAKMDYNDSMKKMTYGSMNSSGRDDKYSLDFLRNDAFALLLLATILENVSVRCDTAKDDQRNMFVRILSAFHVEKTSLKSFVRKKLTQSSNSRGDGDLIESLLRLTPFIFDSMTSSSILCHFMLTDRQQDYSLDCRCMCAALNGIQVSCIQLDDIVKIGKTVCKGIRQLGGAVCVSACSFASQVIKRVGSDDMTSFNGMVEVMGLCVEACLRGESGGKNKGSDNDNSGRVSALRGATVYHVHQVKCELMYDKLSERAMQAVMEIRSETGNAEHEALKIEKTICGQGLNCDGLRDCGRNVRGGSVREELTATRERMCTMMANMRGLGTSKDGGGVSEIDEIKAEAESLWMIIKCMEGRSN